MKIDLCSDLHLIFSPWTPKKTSDDVETLIMAGDVVCINDLYKHTNFFEKVSKLYKNVIYVEGNHLGYGGDHLTALSILRNYLKKFPNIHLLEKQSIQIDDILFIGGCLWTDCNRENPLTMMTLAQSMNDYRVIKNFTVEDSIREHKECLKYFRKELGENKDKKCVVISHHAPSFECIDKNYRNDYHMNGGYFSNLDQFILDRKQIKVWVHGHIHSQVDFMCESTRVLCNPRGYCGIESGNDKIDPYTPKMFEV